MKIENENNMLKIKDEDKKGLNDILPNPSEGDHAELEPIDQQGSEILRILYSKTFAHILGAGLQSFGSRTVKLNIKLPKCKSAVFFRFKRY